MYPDVSLFKSKQDLGFAAVNNHAAKYANGRYLLLLNTDTIVLDGVIQKLYQFATVNPVNQIYGGHTFFSDFTTLKPSSCWWKSSIWCLFCYMTVVTTIFRRNPVFDPELYGRWARDSVRQVDNVNG